MTVGSNIVKITAKTALKGNWVKAIVCCLVIIFSALFNTYISSLIGVFAGGVFSVIFYYLFAALLLFPLAIGVLRFFWRMLLECEDHPISVFYYFSEKTLYLKTMKFLFYTVIKLLPIAVILYLPAVFVWLLSQSFFFELLDMAIPLWTGNLTYALLFARTLATVLLVMFALRYYIAPILFVADENIDAAEALHMSSVITKKTTLDFIYLFFSFIGWMILSVFAIPLIFTVPYMLTAYAVHVRFAITEYNAHIESIKTDDYPTFSVGM